MRSDKRSEKTVKSPIRKGVAKVPVVMQLEALECGAAALAMILAYFGKWVPLEQVRADCEVSRDGSNAKNILLAARGYGLTAGGYRFEPEELKNEGSFPCIVHWNFNHFVVLNGFKGNRAYLNDPAEGSYSVPMETFDESFTGICLLFEPGEGFVPGGRQKSMVDFARGRMKGAGAAIAFTVLATVVSAAFGMIDPAFSRFFLDRLLTHENPEWFLPFLAVLTLVTSVQIAVALARASASLRINGKMEVCGAGAYMWKVLRLPMEFFSQRMAGDIQQRQSANAAVTDRIVNGFAPLVLQPFLMVFYLAVMIRYSWILTLVGVASVFINLVMSRIIAAKRINLTRVRMRDAGLLAAATVAGIEMIETVKASGAENGYFERWAGYQAGENSQSVRSERLDRYLGMIPALASQITGILVTVLGVWLTIENRFTVGMVMAFHGFLESFTGPARTLILAGQSLQEMRAQMERVEDVMQYPEDVNYKEEKKEEDEEKDENGGEYGKLSGAVEIKNVTFGYSRFSRPLIENFSMSLKPGAWVAIVGATGCGKSTVARLVSGVCHPWSGEILFDGRPMDEIDRSVFTGSLAVVDQDIVLFGGTIADNIRMWDSSIEDFEVILAARDARIHDDIMQREGGYNGLLAERGRNLSGGQRQRLEIARVLAQDPTVLILDEATSSLDAETEYEVVKSIRDRGITCIVVAHRLSAIRDCDEIIVLDKGKVVERGTHEELYAKGGYYTELVSNE